MGRTAEPARGGGRDGGDLLMALAVAVERFPCDAHGAPVQLGLFDSKATGSG